LTNSILQFNYDLIPIEQFKELEKELKEYWAGVTVKNRLSGEIIRILNNNERGVHGFINHDNNESVYFSLQRTCNFCEKIKVGSFVEFEISPAYSGTRPKAIILSVNNHQELDGF